VYQPDCRLPRPLTWPPQRTTRSDGDNGLIFDWHHFSSSWQPHPDAESHLELIYKIATDRYNLSAESPILVTIAELGFLEFIFLLHFWAGDPSEKEKLLSSSRWTLGALHTVPKARTLLHSHAVYILWADWVAGPYVLPVVSEGVWGDCGSETRREVWAYLGEEALQLRFRAIVHDISSADGSNYLNTIQDLLHLYAFIRAALHQLTSAQ
jgi:hypothetical protein